MVLVALHKVGDATCATIAEHLLAGLRVLSHHLVLLLLLLLLLFLVLKLVVQCLELTVMIGRGSPTEHCVDVLSERYLRAEAVHLVLL